jgi:hypothetical protein
MRRIEINLEPSNEHDAAVVTEENFRLDIQYAILDAMASKRVTRGQLAATLGVPWHQIDKIFSDECDVSVRFIGRVFHVLGVKFYSKLNGDTNDR